MRKTAIEIAEVTCFLLTALFLLYSLSSVPYYNAWDMDLISAVDLLEIQSGNLPLHINHTGLGIYLINHFWLKLSALGSFVSISNYEELLTSWNMLFTIADFTWWLKNVNFLIVLGIFAFTYLGTKNLLKEKGSLVQLLALLTVLTTASIWNFHLFLVRSELYSLFFFSIGFFYLSRTQKDRFSEFFFLGLLLGLGFVTKIQGFFVMCLMIVMASWEISGPYFSQGKKGKWLLLLSFLLVSILSRLTYLSSHFAEFARGYFPNLFFFTVFGILCLTLYLSRPRLLFGKFAIPPWVNSMGNKWYVLLLGILSAFLFAFLLYTDFSSSFEYFLYLWRMVFLKLGRDHLYTSIHDKFTWTLSYFGPALLALMASFLKYPKTLKSLVLALIMIASLTVGQRASEQDAIWNELLILWLILYFAKSFTQYWSIFPLALLLLGNLINLRPSNFFQSKTLGHMYLTKFLQEPYENPYMLYTETINNTYSEEMKRKSLLYAKSHLSLRQEMGILWESPKLSLSNLNFIERGAKVGEKETIVSFSPSLQEKFISGITGAEEVLLRLDRSQTYAIAAPSGQQLKFENCEAVPTSLSLVTSVSSLEVSQLMIKNWSSYSDLALCKISLSKSSPVFIIKGFSL